ncbi:zinc finger protein 25-like [Anopheles moucheti]|uniref:zinc finger protein 25-like n=1 Tax=Anopheles moucheti TaxID=186751 RepID=UPI0022F096B7|nr:zinc finger protein 25-like [Anopheles moucheti]
MTVFNLLTFPNVCRACLQSVHPDQMVTLDTHRPLLEETISTFLQDISFKLPAAVIPFLPTSVCIACLEVMEFFSKYRRKINHLHEFLVALVGVKLGDERPLRDLFESKTEQLEMLFRDLDLCNKIDVGVNDLLAEYNQYVIGAMEVSSEHEPDESLEQEFSVYDTEVTSEAAKSEPVRAKRLKIEFESAEHNDIEGETVSDENEEASKDTSGQKVKSQRKQFQCDQCSYKTMFTIAHTIHMNKHKQNEGKVGYICSNPYCLQLFDTAKELSQHKMSNPHNVYVCEICGNLLKHRISLEVHLERHGGITHFQCKYCTSSFHTKTELQNHIAAMHISDDRAECQICGAVFTSNKLLKQHTNSHVTERNYHCLNCKRSFKTQHHLNRHSKAVHSDVRYECEHCDVSYSRRDKLRMHVEKAHKIQTYFVCDICLRSFNNDEALQEHSTHHKHPQHLECGICLVVCLTEKDFNRHTCITYQDNYICCGHDFKHHLVYNRHMMRHGIKVNARVRPKSNTLIGIERAQRTAAASRSSKYCLRSVTNETETPLKYNCVECGKLFRTIKERNQHTCSVLIDEIIETLEGSE